MKRFKLTNIVTIFILFIVCAVMLYPIGVLFYISGGRGSDTKVMRPEDRTFINNYKMVLTKDSNLYRFFINSIIIATSVTAIVLFISSMAAFAFSKLKFKYKEIILKFILMGIMIPAGIIIVPLFLLMSKIGLTSNVLSVILVEIGLFTPFSVLVLRNYMDSLPNSIIDAGYIDGCNNWQSYYRIALPLAGPALTAVGIFVYLWSWNEYFIPLVFLRKIELQTVQLAPQYYLRGLFFWDIPLYFASMVVIILPVVILYIIFQNKFIEGLTAGALKE